MILRAVLSFFLVVLITSCDFISNRLGVNFNKTEIDTVIDFNKVDELPVFPVCKNLINTSEKNRCFINKLYNHFSDDLLAHTFGVPACTDEIVFLRLKIDCKGNVEIQELESSELMKTIIPNLRTILQESVDHLPVLFPALKRGIPVSTVFELPIVIKLK